MARSNVNDPAATQNQRTVEAAPVNEPELPDLNRNCMENRSGGINNEIPAAPALVMPEEPPGMAVYRGSKSDNDICNAVRHIDALRSTCQAALERIKELECEWEAKWSAEYGDLMERLAQAERKLAEAERDAEMWRLLQRAAQQTPLPDTPEAVEAWAKRLANYVKDAND